MNRKSTVGRRIITSQSLHPEFMFRIISANPLLDVIYQSQKEALGNRVFFKTTRFIAGGFGPNTARALACLGERVECHMISGGFTGKLIRKDLVENGIRVVSRRGESSRVSAIWVSGQHSRMLVSPSPNISTSVLHRLFDGFQRVTTPEDVVLVGGSVAKDVMPTYLERIRTLSLANKYCCCDVRTHGWRDLLSANLMVMKLPHLESAKLSVNDLMNLLREVVANGTRLALCSAGPRLLLAATAKEIYLVKAPAVRVVNPYGAGDCLMAVLATSIARKRPIQRSLMSAVAAATASVMTPVPGEFEPVTAQRLLRQVRIESKPI